MNGVRPLGPRLPRNAFRLALASAILTVGGCTATATPGAGTSHQGVPVPRDLVATMVSASTSCRALTAPRLAGLIMATSRFDAGATTAGGGTGIAGLTGELWQKWAPWPQAQRQDPAANVVALAHHLCDLAGQLRAGGLPADNWDLTVAAYRAGIDQVVRARSIPESVLGFVTDVSAYTAWYGTAGELSPTPGKDEVPAEALAAPTTPGGSRPGTPAAGGVPARTAPSPALSGGRPAPPPASPAGGTPAPAGKPTAVRTTAAAAAAAVTRYRIVGYAGKCVHASAVGDGKSLQLSTCTGTDRQRWVFTDGTIRMSGLCLDAAGASSADGTRIQLARCNGTWAQQFWVNGSNDLVNSVIGKCVDVTDRGTADGTPLQLWTCTGAANQKWSQVVS